MVEHCSKNKKILVDCRMINASGIGVYTREIIKELKNIDTCRSNYCFKKNNIYQLMLKI